MAEKIFDAQVNYGWGLTLNMTGKAPAISKRIFDTLADAQAYVDDANDSAIAGLQLSVIADTDTSKNGIYFVSKIGTASEAGTLVKIGSDAAASIEELQQKVGALETDVNALKSIDHTALENKIEVVKVNGKALDINDKAVDITIETPTYDADVTTAKDSTTTAPATKAVYDFVDGIKTSLEGKLNAIETWKLEVVDSLEGIAEINAKTIYLVLADAQHQGDKNKYKEYIYVNDTWEQLGELDVAFDPADLQQQITDLGTRVDTIETNLGNLTTKVTTIENKIKEITEVGGEPNKINTISLNSKAVSFTVDAAKNADLTLDVDYDTTTKKVRLKSGNTILSSFDASAFIKDGMLNSAEIITVPSDGEEATIDRPAGKYIKLTWNTDAGKEATYIPVKDIIKEYTFAGSADGISLHSATRGNVKITDTLTATTDSDGTIRVKSGGSLADGSWFTKVDEELDAVPTTYAKAADVDTLEEKVDSLVTAGGEPNKIETISLNNKKASFTVDASKNADLTLDVNYDADTKKVQLKSGETVLSDFDASALVKDSDLDSVTLVTRTTADATDERPVGKYIKLTWNKDAGKEDVYINAENAYPYIDTAAIGGTGYNSETRGSWGIYQTLNITALPTGDIKRTFGIEFLPGDDVDGKTGNWFKAVEDELDAIPTTYAKAADVTTSLKAKADKTELPTVSANGSISIQDTLNYGDNSFAIDLDVTKTGVNNEVKLSESGFTTWVSAVDTQVKTNTDAIAGIPENFIVGDGFNYSYQTTYEDSHGDTHYNDYILSFVPNIEVVDENGVKKVKIGIINTSPNQVEEVGDTANYNLLDTWKDKLNNASMQGHTHVIADITDFDTITTEDIDALFA